MKILLIRHGDPDYAIDSLTEKGWREAKLLSNRLEKLEIRDFYVSPLGRARKSKGFQRNLRKGGAEGNPSPLPPGELERAAALSNFQSKRFPQEIVSFSSGGGSGGGACSPVHLTRTACTSS